ncbi:MAG: helix-turn-helix domain-containing protein [Planctomycetota bacterium]|jgi:transcriptional regulator with XRE-family HTH domain
MPRKKRKPIGEILKARRLDLGKTQSEVADKAGVRQNTVSRLEHGIGRETLTTGLQIARVLGLQRDDLID